MTARAHKKKQDYLIERIMNRLDKIEKHPDYVDDDDRSVAAHDVEEVYHMEAELEKAETDVIEVLCGRGYGPQALDVLHAMAEAPMPL